MGKLYKRTDVDSPYWYTDYTQANGKRKRRCTNCRDKSNARKLLAQWEAEAVLTKAGVTEDNTTIKRRLNEYLDHLRSLDRYTDYVEKSERLIQRVIDHAGWHLLSHPVFSPVSLQEMARVLRADCEAARPDQSDDGFLRSNEEGVLDFHALRHTAGAWRVMNGMTLPECQQLMRHSTIVLTIDCYGHLDKDAMRKNRNSLEKFIG